MVIDGKDVVAAEYAIENQVLRSTINDLNIELDRMGAPRNQDNGFSYNPVGRLRRLSREAVGELSRKKIRELDDQVFELNRKIKELTRDT